MIISASRRTDIPAFYSRWLLDRVRAGEVYVRNPFDRRKISRVSLRREHVDYIHFWTKNPAPLLSRIGGLDGYRYCFHFTVNGYGRETEPAVPLLPVLLDTFRQLSDRCGPGRVAWRYCPILIRPGFGVEQHLRNFETIAGTLAGYTERCHISLLDEYYKIKNVMHHHGIRRTTAEEESILLPEIVRIAAGHGIRIYSCADTEGLSGYGITPGRCLDPGLPGLSGGAYKKDRNQHPECLCSESVDIGGYSSCPHECLYCYANRTTGLPAANFQIHNPLSPLIYGEPLPGDIVTEHSLSTKARQRTSATDRSLFDQPV
ncbi:MAG: DUF1848 domain-containing protein [Rikenellaceae bacterium]|nr:DUF1848 domain-containing protein [Rikenellaceae bacterium]